MPPLDWDKVMSAKPASLKDDEVDAFYEELVSYDPTETDAAKLQQLFKVAKKVMKSKHDQVEEAMDVMEKEAKDSKKKEQEMKNEIKDLEKKMKELEKFGPETTGTGTARVLRDELQDLQKQVEDLQDEKKDLQRALQDERLSSEKYSERINELEKENRELREDSEQLRQDIVEYKKQLQTHTRTLAREEESDYREKMKRKNRELADAMEELQNLTDANDEMKRKCDELQASLQEAIQQMDQTNEDYHKLKLVLQQSDAITDKIRQENDILRSQVADLTEQVESKTDADDAIMVALNNKIEEWKTILQDKDQTILEQQEQIFHLRDQLIAANMDTDKTSVAALSRVVKEKDKQIEELTGQIKTYVDEMETNAAIIDDLRQELEKTGKGPGDRQQQKIKELQNEVKFLQEKNKEYAGEVKSAGQDAEEKDKALTEALQRMRQYEAGEYGLADAVAEIKDGKTQLKVRDRQIEEITQHINKAEMQINDLCEENEELRRKLGLDPRKPLDLTQFRKNNMIRKEEDRALNIILQREVERLEEERLELKKKIRRLAQQSGQRAVALGLTADDMLAIDEFTENLKTRKEPEGVAEVIKREVAQQETAMRHVSFESEFRDNMRENDRLFADNAKLKAKVHQLEEDNKNLEAGLKEVIEAMKQHSGDEVEETGADRKLMQFPTLERMLAAIEARNVLGQYDTSMFLKAQVDNLMGRNDEIRTALRETRHEANKAQLELEKAVSKIQDMEEELKAIRDTGGGPGFFRAMPLPDAMTVSSSEVIASLNEHLVVVLQELHLKEESVRNLETSLENYKRRFAVVRHQQGLIYQDYLKDRKAWEEEVKKLKEELKNVEGSREEDKVKLQEFDRLVDTLAKDEPEVRRRLSEMTRRITVLRVNEKALTRRHNIMEEVEGQLRKEVNRLKNEMAAMETAVSERLGYLQRYKDTSVFKIAALQKALDDSVPVSELDLSNKKYHELTEKYRDLLEKGNNLVTRAEALTGLEGEVKRLTVENEEVKRTLTHEKEKLHTLEAAVEELHRRGVTEGTDVKGLTDADIISTSKKITTLEMKELNERQKAEHSVRMFEQQKKILEEVENRNRELEEKFSEITKSNLELQKIERELRDELANSVTKAVSDADRKKISELEASELNLKHEISKLKEISEVASSQVKTLEMQHISKEKEVQSLRQQLLDFQVQSDEKTIIGKLHRHIVQLQVSEGTAVRKLEEMSKKVYKFEAHILRLEQKLDAKDDTMYHNRAEAQNKVKHLKKNLHEMRLQFAGAIPLSKQERFSNTMMQLQRDKNNIEIQLKEVRQKKDALEDKLAEVELQHKSLQDLIATIKDGKGAAKVIEWHGKMDAVRLEELKQKRINGKLNRQIKYLEEVIRAHENTISELEADNVRMLKEYEERQLRWEHREVELERNIATMEKQAEEIAGAASKFEEAVGSLPNSKLPLSNQLEQAIATIRSNVRIILDTQAESKKLKERNKELEKVLKETEKLLIQRDKLIAELRLRMPASAERDEMILQATSKVTEAMKNQSSRRDYETEQSIKIAHSTISSLQARLQQKEETIEKYQELLNQARNEMQDMNKRQEKELKAMQEKIHMNTDAAFSKFKEATHQLMSKQMAQPISNKQIQRLQELEDLVAERENALAAMSEKIKQRDAEILNLRTKLHQQETRTVGEKEKLEGHIKSETEKRDSEIDQLMRTVEHQKKEIELLNEEIATLKESNNRAPTTTMKNLVERLKNQLALKEKQHQALTKALTELRADMVQNAQEQVKIAGDDSDQQVNIQKLIDKHTKEMVEQVEDLQTQAERQKKEIKKRREQESTLHTEIDDLKEEMGRKDRVIHKLKEDKQSLQQEVDELEKKVERMNTMKQQKTGDEARNQEMEEMRRKVRLLEDELKRKRQQAEKPYEQKELVPETRVTLKEMPGKTGEELLKWEESKKWQKTVEKMRSKIKEKDAEIEKLQKSNQMMKDMLDRANREKDTIERKLIGLQKGPTAPTAPSGPPGKTDHDMESLKQKNFQLQEEISNLRRQLMLGKDAAFEETQMRNQQLMEQVDQMEKVISKKIQQTEASGPTAGPALKDYQELFEKNQNLQKQLLKLSEENIELKFETEQARKDVPRLKDRINDLQKYVEALKIENAQLSSGDKSNRSFDSSSSIRRIGESGKSTRELEKTIALLKKVVERVQMENEQLKRAPGVVSNDRFQQLQRENESLKAEMEDMRQKFGSSLSERYTSSQKGTAKLMADYEKLRRDLIKEMDSSEKLRIQIKNLEIKNEQLSRNVEDSKTKLEIEEAKRPNLQTMDTKGWKSVVVTRMYEEKIKAMEAELEKKNKLLSDTKILLKEAAEREQKLIHEKDELQNKISILERFPEGSSLTDSEVMRDYQKARVRIDQLEKEKKEWIHELRMARKQSASGTDLFGDDMLTKASNYDKVMTENIELRMALKSTELDKDKFRLDNERMKKELANFGPEFFEEIEDLKFNYKQALEKNIIFEEKLKQLSRQFGVQIPGF
ncbi:hypothetical protein ACJMK2_028144 [Sinanodonta woodiana]|uniref:Centrosomal protein of 290kDa coiled-coil region domain-containing protein n=1 Tax=Sinanodonta woodiana TaxID=1069815 RepID=A0ABD3X666_SINWO